MLCLSNESAEGDPPSVIRTRALSLGAGVQSTTLSLMAAHGAVGPACPSSSIATIAQDNGASAALVCPHHAVPEQDPGNNRAAYSRKPHSDECLYSSFPVARFDTGDRQTAGQWYGGSRSGSCTALSCSEIDLPIVRL